jgi:F-type H+-transporting ATPase subunit a
MMPGRNSLVSGVDGEKSVLLRQAPYKPQPPLGVDMSRHTKTSLLTILALLSASPALAASEAAAPLSEFIRLPITNSVLTSWVFTIVFVFLIRWLVGKPTLVPNRGQAVVEGLMAGLRDILEPIIGKKAMPAAFPLLLCFFVFILLHNWSGMIPFVGTMGWFKTVADGSIEFYPLLRPHTADANGTVALALVSFGAWFIIIFKYAGPKLILHDLFGNKADKKDMNAGMYAFLSVIFLLVGIIEIVSIFIRPVTLSARLFGNVYGGENLLHATHYVFIFYFLEIIVGLVQAFVFTLLSAVYIGLICNHGDDHAHDDDHGHAAGDAHPAKAAH